MRTLRRRVVILALSLMDLAANAAIADTMTIKLLNDGPDELVATVYDMNAQSPEAATSNQRISGFSWVPVLVTAGPTGHAHVKWIARNADPVSPRCGHRERRGLANDATVRVFANSQCGESLH
jgi:hypothetical protein